MTRAYSLSLTFSEGNNPGSLWVECHPGCLNEYRKGGYPPSEGLSPGVLNFALYSGWPVQVQMNCLGVLQGGECLQLKTSGMAEAWQGKTTEKGLRN